MRKTINISVPESMFTFIHEKGKDEFYGSASEYIRTLVRRDWFYVEKKKRGPKPRRMNDYFVRRDKNVDEK